MAQERKCQVIKIENVVVSGWEAAIRGMRNPMNSWSQSDSHVCNEYTIREEMPCQMVENDNRERFVETKDKYFWWQMIQLLPSSYNQRRTVLLNYAVLANIYQYRKEHKLDEWRNFCRWIETLPYSEVITGERDAQAPEAD